MGLPRWASLDSCHDKIFLLLILQGHHSAEESASAALACSGIAACLWALLGAWHPRDGEGLPMSGVRPASQGAGRSSGLGGEAGGSWRGFQPLPSLGTGCTAATARGRTAPTSPPTELRKRRAGSEKRGVFCRCCLLGWKQSTERAEPVGSVLSGPTEGGRSRQGL